MSDKSAMYEMFKNRKGFRIVEVPKSMRPTQESLEKLGKKIAWGIRRHDTTPKMMEKGRHD